MKWAVSLYETQAARFHKAWCLLAIRTWCQLSMTPDQMAGSKTRRRFPYDVSTFCLPLATRARSGSTHASKSLNLPCAPPSMHFQWSLRSACYAWRGWSTWACWWTFLLRGAQSACRPLSLVGLPRGGKLVMLSPEGQSYSDGQ